MIKSGVRASFTPLAAFCALAAATAIPTTGSAQQPQQVASVPPPDQAQLTKLIWATMVAVDQANQSGNYSVLRDISAPGFQAANDPAKLAQIFGTLRASGTDLSATLLLGPQYRAAPRMVQADMVQVVGTFASRPTSINFELLYQWVGGRWRLFGVAIVPTAMAGQAAAPAPAPAPAPPRKK